MKRKTVKRRTFKVWVLVDANGHIYASACNYSRRDCLRIPHERGVTAKRATLTLDTPKKAGKT